MTAIRKGVRGTMKWSPAAPQRGANGGGMKNGITFVPSTSLKSLGSTLYFPPKSPKAPSALLRGCTRGDGGRLHSPTLVRTPKASCTPPDKTSSSQLRLTMQIRSSLDRKRLWISGTSETLLNNQGCEKIISSSPFFLNWKMNGAQRLRVKSLPRIENISLYPPKEYTHTYRRQQVDLDPTERRRKYSAVRLQD